MAVKKNLNKQLDKKCKYKLAMYAISISLDMK